MSPAIPFLILGAGVAIAYLSTLKQVVNAAERLRYQVTRIQIYRFKLNQPIVFRVWVEFTNLADIDIIIQSLYIDIFLNFGETGKDKKQRIATLYPNHSIVIPANQRQEIAFDVEVKWVNLGLTVAEMLKERLNNANMWWPSSATVEGELKAENFTIPIDMEVPFNSNSIEKQEE